MAEEKFGKAGVYRWDVKTASDPASASLKGVDSTVEAIADLIRLAPPTVTMDLPRQAGAESTVYLIEGVLVAYKAESDQDYHLVVQDGSGRSMIVEIPDPSILTPACNFKEEITAARAAFDARFGKQMAALKMALTQVGEPLMITKVNQPVRVTGIGYFDEIHGQTGVAPNGIEIHPVLKIEFLGGTS